VVAPADLVVCEQLKWVVLDLSRGVVGSGRRGLGLGQSIYAKNIHPKTIFWELC
jgi:hypothetical protein